MLKVCGGFLPSLHLAADHAEVVVHFGEIGPASVNWAMASSYLP
jgi:hypothetical protein